MVKFGHTLAKGPRTRWVWVFAIWPRLLVKRNEQVISNLKNREIQSLGNRWAIIGVSSLGFKLKIR